MELAREEKRPEDFFCDFWAAFWDADCLEGWEDVGFEAGGLDTNVEGGVRDHDIIVWLVSPCCQHGASE